MAFEKLNRMMDLNSKRDRDWRIISQTFDYMIAVLLLILFFPLISAWAVRFFPSPLMYIVIAIIAVGLLSLILLLFFLRKSLKRLKETKARVWEPYFEDRFNQFCKVHLWASIVLAVLGILTLSSVVFAIGFVLLYAIIIFTLFVDIKYIKVMHREHWKMMPLGVKVLIGLLAVNIFLALINLLSYSKRPEFLFGFFVGFPASYAAKLASIFISALIIFLLFERRGWKVILGLQSLKLLNGTIGWIVILVTPLADLASKLGIQEVPSAAKTIASVPAVLGIIMSIIIIFYIYKMKGYFSK